MSIRTDPRFTQDIDLVVAVEVVEGRVHAVHAIRNPEKIAALDVPTSIT